MLQNFLAERFHLKLHIQSREFPAYELVIAKTGPKLGVPAAKLPAGDGWPELRPDRPGIAARNSFSGGFNLVRLRAQQEPLSALARMLRNAEDLPIVDKAGWTGKYDFTLEYTMGVPAATPDGLAESSIALELSGALQKQLGLQLRSQEGAVRCSDHRHSRSTAHRKLTLGDRLPIASAVRPAAA